MVFRKNIHDFFEYPGHVNNMTQIVANFFLSQNSEMSPDKLIHEKKVVHDLELNIHRPKETYIYSRFFGKYSQSIYKRKLSFPKNVVNKSMLFMNKNFIPKKKRE